MKRYNFKKIEKKWLNLWLKSNLWKAKYLHKSKKKKYILGMFPYPSGQGLHVGHVEGYTATDILSRFYRMNGYNVLHPMGFDSFGLPAENYAIKKKKHPSLFVPKNINRYRRQLMSLGFSYDWSREISTTDIEYYKWTQWMFLQMYKKGLVYEKEAPINFCPNCKTGLADEEAIGGKCERCGSLTEIKFLRQWHIKITAYADRLLNDLQDLDWPEHIKEMQRNWIGKSEGYEVIFPLSDSQDSIKVFTTRLDTIYGTTFIVLSISHHLIFKITKPDYMKFMEDYVRNEIKKEKLGIIDKETTGIFTGSYAINPINKFKIPIWVSNYVLSGYGTGAIMAVPAHDERDWNFAKKFNLDIIRVITSPKDKGNAMFDSDLYFTDDGILINSEKYSGLTSSEAREKIGDYLISLGLAEKKVYYKLRDWIFSRQRYWGEPIPLIRCRKCGIVPVPEKNLPVTLPKVKNYKPAGTGESPLKNIHSWVKVKCPQCFSIAERETQTMPQWAGSCWYFLAYILKNNQSRKNYQIKFDIKKLKYWMPVDIYIGGVEHAVLHLLYARFWNQFLYDLKLVPYKEPFIKLFNQGIILGIDGHKMSKSRGNIVNPDDVIKQYGADVLRMFEMFLGPLESEKPWSTDGIKGIKRFLQRIWILAYQLKKQQYKTKNKKLSKQYDDDSELKIALNKLIYETTQGILNFRFNTIIAKMMVFEDLLRKQIENNVVFAKEAFLTFIKLLFPFAPFIAQEIWCLLGKKTFLDKEKWPTYDSRLLKNKIINYIIQVNGKKRGILEVEENELSLEDIKLKIKTLPLYKKYLDKKKIQRIIFVKGKIINFVLKDV